MRESELMPRFMACLVGACLVIIMVIFLRPNKTESITFGMLAEKVSDFSCTPVKVSNCAGGTQHGKYFVIPTKTKDRYAVVFVLRTSAAIDPAAPTICGYCDGIQKEKIEGCPCDAPFVIVIDAYVGN